MSIADDVLARLGAEEDDLVITWRHDDMIECVARDVDTLISVIDDNAELFNVYQVRDNRLEFLGNSKLVSILTPSFLRASTSLATIALGRRNSGIP